MQDTVTGLTIRKATAQDALACVPLVYSAGPELFDYIYAHAGFKPQQFIQAEFAHGSGFMGHKLHWVAEQDGDVVGVCALYSRKDLLAMNIATTARILKTYGIKSAKPVAHALDAGSLISVPTKTGLHLANFGVSAQKRSAGIGSSLLKHAANHAKKLGFKGLSLDVSVQNPRGQALYERTGFKVVRENTFKGHSDSVPNARLMYWEL